MKQYTKETVAREILEDPDIAKYMNIFVSDEIFSSITEEYLDKTLRELESVLEMPWGGPFIPELLLDGAKRVRELTEEKRFAFVPLWNNSGSEEFIPDMNKNNKANVCLMYLRNKNDSFSGKKRPAALICPGGGYELLAVTNEGVDFAERMEEAGYASFVLFYRVSPEHYPEPQKDLALAIKYLRANADEYGIDPERILIMGSSAAGHLCASESAYYHEIDHILMEDIQRNHPELSDRYKTISARADMVCLAYPVIDFMQYAHEPSFQALTGGNEVLREKLSVQNYITKEFPKAFLWACQDDPLVPYQNCECMGKALKDAGTDCCVRIYPQGGHGCGLAYGTSAQSWMDEMLAFLSDTL